MPASNKQRVAVLEERWQKGQRQGQRDDRGHGITMAQLVEEKAIGSVFVAGEKPHKNRRNGRRARSRCRLSRRHMGLRMPIVYHTVPLSQALCPQQGNRQKRGQQPAGEPRAGLE